MLFLSCNTEVGLKNKILSILKDERWVANYWDLKDTGGEFQIEIGYDYVDTEWDPDSTVINLTENLYKTLLPIFEQLVIYKQNNLLKLVDDSYEIQLLKDYVNGSGLKEAPIQEVDIEILRANGINTTKTNAFKVNFSQLEWLLYEFDQIYDYDANNGGGIISDLNNKVVDQIYKLDNIINLNKFTYVRFSDYTIDLELTLDEVTYLLKHAKIWGNDSFEKMFLHQKRKLRIDSYLLS